MAHSQDLELVGASDFLSDFSSEDIGGYLDGDEIDPVDFQQPGTARPPTTVRRPTRRPVTGQEIAPPSASDLGDYLASAPRMFGHYYGSNGQLFLRTQDNFGLTKTLRADIPMAGGASPLQITDNNTPVPQSRWFFGFNHYERALRTQSGGNTLFLPVDQYTVGTEQSFFDGISSFQIQLPMTGGFGTIGGPGVAAGQFGNLGLISKTAIWRSDYAILSGGLGLELPTGSSTIGRQDTARFQVQNTSTTLLPFVGVMVLPTDATFVQFFATATLPASGNQLVAGVPGGPMQPGGVFTPQSRMHLDLMGGSWFYQNPGGTGITGMALIGEVHYVAAMQPGDFVNFTTPGMQGAGPSFYQLGNLSNQQTATNFTIGLHTVWNNRFQFRIGGAFPLAQRPNRNFDGEVIAQLNFIP